MNLAITMPQRPVERGMEKSMPYLNWKDVQAASPGSENSEPQAKVSAVFREQHDAQVTVEISPGSLPELLASLEEVLLEGVGELRWELPSSWTLFFKSREGDGRLLVAHPERECWVGTVSLSQERAPLFLEKLRTIGSQNESLVLSRVDFSSHQLGPWSSVSNLEVILRLKTT